MSPGTLTILLFIGILLSFAIGTPVGFALGGVAMLFGAFTWGPQAFSIIPHAAMGGLTNFILLAIPLFIFMGQILLRSGMGESMFHAIHILAGRLRGGLAIGVIVMCTLMSAMVGIIGAGIMTAGTVAIPQARIRQNLDSRIRHGRWRHGYPDSAIHHHDRFQFRDECLFR
jgi:TRAP-type mannitol/chloroaromatic compound transport system permease large subunit